MSEPRDSNLRQRVPAGQIIKPWIMLGPFYENVSAHVTGLTLFERPGSTVGASEMEQVVDESRTLLAQDPHEGQQTTFRGQDGTWELVRRPEKFFSWGEYNVMNHLVVAFLATTIIPSRPGTKQWLLTTRITSRVVVTVGHAVVLDTRDADFTRTDDGAQYSFSADLSSGENPVRVAMFRMGRMVQVGCRLEVSDDDITAQVPLSPSVSEQVRSGVEQELTGLHLGRDIFYPQDPVSVTLDRAPSPATVLRVNVISDSTGEWVAGAAAHGAGPLVLCQGRDLPDGFYTIACTWSVPDGPDLTSTKFQIRKVSPTALPATAGRSDAELADERDRLTLETFAGFEDYSTLPRDVLWPQVARYALGRVEEVNEDAIRQGCEFVAARSDCADFTIQGLLRLMYWERDHQRLSPEINALMRDTVLGFKYWVDEPGDTVMYMGSENHRFAFHVAEWMAGQLFPNEVFSNSDQRGLFHAAKGRMYITEWLRQRGRFGFDEWHSNAYFPVCLAPLSNVHEFALAEDSTIKGLARSVLDYMAFILAADSFQGIFGVTHGRSYTRYIKHPGMEATSAISWLWYGLGTLVRETRGILAPMTLASGTYRPPGLFAEIAADNTAVVESKQRQGLFSGSQQSANFVVYRTPDYQISAVQDHRKGEFESSTHVAQVTMANQALLFWSCPQTTGEGAGLRPDYWSGHTTLPRVIQHRNVMALTWRPSTYSWMTHCFFESERFDDVRFSGNWVFARAAHGYVAIHSEHGMTLGREGQYAGRELICEAPANTWLVECGREADWGSFDAFVQAVGSAPLEHQDGVLRYESPSVGEFLTGWDIAPTVAGRALQLSGYPMIESPWATSAFGSGELEIRYGDEKKEIWFNQ